MDIRLSLTEYVVIICHKELYCLLTKIDRELILEGTQDELKKYISTYAKDENVEIEYNKLVEAIKSTSRHKLEALVLFANIFGLKKLSSNTQDLVEKEKTPIIGKVIAIEHDYSNWDK